MDSKEYYKVYQQWRVGSFGDVDKNENGVCIGESQPSNTSEDNTGFVYYFFNDYIITNNIVFIHQKNNAQIEGISRVITK